MQDGYVYFIQCGESGPIKIGYSKNNIEKRLIIAQVYNPFLLHLLCAMPGNRKKEKELHKTFKDDKILGEWFDPSIKLLKLINTLPQLGFTSEDIRKSGPSFIDHCSWKGKGAKNLTKRQRTARRYRIYKGDLCGRCGIKNANDRYHKDGNLDNNGPENILKVCRRCCMELDGRLDKLIQKAKNRKPNPPKPCIICRDLYKPLRKKRCRNCYEYFRRHAKDKEL